MQHAFVFVPHECCTARACVVARVRLFFVLSAFGSGWVGGSLKASRSALLVARAMASGALARGRFGVVAGARDEPIEFSGARTGGEPSGIHRDRRVVARDTARGPGRYTNTGHGPDKFLPMFQLQFIDRAVDTPGVLDDEGLVESSFVQSRVEPTIRKGVLRSGMSRFCPSCRARTFLIIVEKTIRKSSVGTWMGERLLQTGIACLCIVSRVFSCPYTWMT